MRRICILETFTHFYLIYDLSSDQMLNWEDEIVEAVNIVKDSKISESFVK